MAELIKHSFKDRARQQRQQGDLEGAVRTVREGVASMGAELADLHGILGSLHRQQDDLEKAAAAYDDGFEIDSRYGIVSSYNALNRLITRIMLDPEALSDPTRLRHRKRLAYVDVRKELAELQVKLQARVDDEPDGDLWAIGDLAVAAALNSDLKGARAAVARFVSRKPAEFVWTAYLQTVAALARLDTRSKQTLGSIEKLLAVGHDPA